MTTPSEAPADRRSLAASAAIGSCVGLAIGSAYVAGALARNSVDEAQARQVAAVVQASRAITVAAASPGEPALRTAVAAIEASPQVLLRGSQAPARDLECLSQAVYYEARGEEERGRQAVAQVVMNRTRQPRFPRSICGVVFQHAATGCAFSFACDGQTRHALEPAAWRDARRIAQRTLAGFVLPELRTATDFRSGGGAPAGLERVAQIGAHVFYRWTGHAGGAPQAARRAAATPVAAPSEPVVPPAPMVVRTEAPVARPAPEATPTA